MQKDESCLESAECLLLVLSFPWSCSWGSLIWLPMFLAQVSDRQECIVSPSFSQEWGENKRQTLASFFYLGVPTLTRSFTSWSHPVVGVAWLRDLSVARDSCWGLSNISQWRTPGLPAHYLHICWHPFVLLTLKLMVNKDFDLKVKLYI